MGTLSVNGIYSGQRPMGIRRISNDGDGLRGQLTSVFLHSSGSPKKKARKIIPKHIHMFRARNMRDRTEPSGYGIICAH